MSERGTEAWVWENPKAAKAEIDRLAELGQNCFREVAVLRADLAAAEERAEKAEHRLAVHYPLDYYEAKNAELEDAIENLRKRHEQQLEMLVRLSAQRGLRILDLREAGEDLITGGVTLKNVARWRKVAGEKASEDAWQYTTEPVHREKTSGAGAGRGVHPASADRGGMPAQDLEAELETTRGRLRGAEYVAAQREPPTTVYVCFVRRASGHRQGNVSFVGPVLTSMDEADAWAAAKTAEGWHGSWFGAPFNDPTFAGYIVE